MDAPSAARAVALRQAGIAASASAMPTITTKPSSRTTPSTARPGSGSARRATPIGISGDAATATTTAISAPTTLVTAARSIVVPNSCTRVTPSARSASLSTASRKVRRENAWPMTRSPVSAITAANTERAPTDGRTARSTLVAVLVRALERDGLAGNQGLDGPPERREVCGAAAQADAAPPIGHPDIGVAPRERRREQHLPVLEALVDHDLVGQHPDAGDGGPEPLPEGARADLGPQLLERRPPPPRRDAPRPRGPPR